MTENETLFSLASTDSVLFTSDLPIYRIEGDDAVRYLHGRVTQDIKSLKPGFGARSLVLTPQGKIQGQFIILKDEKGFLLIADPLSSLEARTDFVSALLQFKVADDVKLTEHTSALTVMSLIGTTAEALLKNPAMPKEPYSFAAAQIAGHDVLVMRNPRGSLPGFDLIVSKEHQEELIDAVIGLDSPPVPIGNVEVLEMIRISAKRPRMEADLSDKVLGPEINVDDLVSFNKGCYAGQEVVEMATARGRPNRSLMLFEAEGKELPAAGTELKSEDKNCGWLTSGFVLPSSNKVRALGFIKTSAQDLTEFQAGGLTFRPLP